MEYAYNNGMSALALTDHGNCNGLAYQVLHAKKMKDAGRDFKPIFGVEAYFHPSIDGWKEDYEEAKKVKKNRSALKDGGTGGAVVEDEQRNFKGLVNRRNHLILLAQNQTGLNNIFKMVSDSFSGDNYYRFPRVDYELLAKHSEGVIAASACLGGVYAGCMWRNAVTDEEGNRTGFDEEAVLADMRETTREMQKIFGNRWYGELQWNNIPEQHILNNYIIQMSKEFDMKLISTADSHYPNPDAWKDRILYKKLG